MRSIRDVWCGASRATACIALSSACLALPFFAYAKAAEAWGLAVALGSFGALGAIYACADWWVIQRKQNNPANIRAVWKTALFGVLVCSGWGLMGQTVLVYSNFLPLAFFEEPGLEDPGYWSYAFDALLLSPIGEEILFRAWLLGSVWHARTLWLRLAVSCLVFPFAHLILEPGQTQENLMQGWRMLLLLVPSLVFVWVWLRTRSLLACFMTHAISNAVPALPWWVE